VCIALLSTFLGSKIHALGTGEIPLDKKSKQTRTKFRMKRKEEGREGGRERGIKESGRGGREGEGRRGRCLDVHVVP